MKQIFKEIISSYIHIYLIYLHKTLEVREGGTFSRFRRQKMYDRVYRWKLSALFVHLCQITSSLSFARENRCFYSLIPCRGFLSSLDSPTTTSRRLSLSHLLPRFFGLQGNSSPSTTDKQKARIRRQLPAPEKIPFSRKKKRKIPPLRENETNGVSANFCRVFLQT